MSDYKPGEHLAIKNGKLVVEQTYDDVQIAAAKELAKRLKEEYEKNLSEVRN